MYICIHICVHISSSSRPATASRPTSASSTARTAWRRGDSVLIIIIVIVMIMLPLLIFILMIMIMMMIIMIMDGMEVDNSALTGESMPEPRIIIITIIIIIISSSILLLLLLLRIMIIIMMMIMITKEPRHPKTEAVSCSPTEAIYEFAKQILVIMLLSTPVLVYAVMTYVFKPSWRLIYVIL